MPSIIFYSARRTAQKVLIFIGYTLTHPNEADRCAAAPPCGSGGGRAPPPPGGPPPPAPARPPPGGGGARAPREPPRGRGRGPAVLDALTPAARFAGAETCYDTRR